MFKRHQIFFGLVPFAAGMGFGLHWFHVDKIAGNEPLIAVAAMLGVAAASLYFVLCKKKDKYEAPDLIVD